MNIASFKRIKRHMIPGDIGQIEWERMIKAQYRSKRAKAAVNGLRARTRAVLKERARREIAEGSQNGLE